MMGLLGYLFFCFVGGDDEEDDEEDNKEEKELELARVRYQGALDKLAEENSSDNKIKALELGRHYASLSRKVHQGDKSVTLFDEVALTDDINARLNS